MRNLILPNIVRYVAILILMAAIPPLVCRGNETGQRPDVLFLIVDDMNDWISLLDDDAPIRTPNLERLAARGVSFTKAYCASPACNPSRASTLTGIRASTSGAYGNKSDWRRAMPDRLTVMQQFQKGGYEVRGAGKIFHHHLDGAFHDDASFDDFRPMKPQVYPPAKLNRAPDYGTENTDWGAWPPREEDAIDFETASYCVEQLTNPPREKPLFLACGIYKPHSPFFAPASYHQPYRGIGLPVLNSQDRSDLPEGALRLLDAQERFWLGMKQLDDRIEGSYADFIRSYAACASFADAQIGRVLDALDKSPRGKNTIIVLWSDHGFHLGEKDHIEKFALWEKSTHIPFIVVAPTVATPGTKCDRPVDMIALYPTLLELAGLPADPTCEGVSLVPLLETPGRAWEQPAVMTYLRDNHAVRSDRWRYIRYADGSEELYDHQSDPNEWTNLAEDPQFESVKQQHRKWLPKTNAREVGELKVKGAKSPKFHQGEPR